MVMDVELKEKRGRKVKQYLHRDGTITAKVFCDNIHFLKNGVYEEIDNTLVKEKNYYINKDNDYKIYFFENTNQLLMKMEKENHYLNIKLDNCNDVKINVNKSKNKLRSSLIYNNILDGVDFKYDISSNQVKETIILKNENILLDNICFLLKSDLDLVLENNEIFAKDNEEIVFKFEIPYMYDSNNLVNENVNYILSKYENFYKLELVLDFEWLKGNVKYPIYVDPTITNCENGGTVYDTYISSNAKNTNKGMQDILKCGVERINGTDVVHRTLLKFDLPPITTGDEIIDAHLELFGYLSSDNSFYEESVSIHRITSDWNETTATWNNMNDKFDSRIEGIYELGRSTVDSNGILSPGYASVWGIITDLVKKWYVDLPNYGILLKATREKYNGVNYPACYSKNNTLNIDENIQPTLVITYRNQNGLEDYLNYMTQSFSIGSTNINTYNGNVVGVWKVGATIGGKLPIGINLIYNTNDVVLGNNSVFGKGYKLNLDQKIVFDRINNDDCLKYYDEDGTIHYFLRKYEFDDDWNLQPVGTSFYDEDGLDLIIDEINNSYVMTDKAGSKMLFAKSDGIGYLSEIEDCSSNKIIIERDDLNNISKIYDANNSEISIIYKENEIEVVSPDSTTYLEYIDGLLTKIVTYGGETNFSYNSNYIITDVIDINGLKIKYEYYEKSPYRIKKVTQYGLNNEVGNSFELRYELNATTIIDNLDRINTLIFNSRGNLISENSLDKNNDINNAYSITRNYGEHPAEKNKLIETVVPVRYVKNYLSNTSFEQDFDIFNSSSNLVKSYDTSYVRNGNRSLKVVSSDLNSYLEKTISVPKGKYYTFSGYFINNKSLTISLSYLNNNGVLVEENILKDTCSNFEREDVTIYYDESATSDLYINIHFEDESITYIDDIQLEEGEIANNYNMIENSDFSQGLSNWELEAFEVEPYDSTTVYNPNDYFSVVKVNDDKSTALKIKMDPNNATSFVQTLPIKGKMGDVFHLSFWYKNEGTCCDAIASSAGNTVYIMWNPVDESYATQIMQFYELPVNLNYWQYFSQTFIAEYDYDGLRLDFGQCRDANNFYITNLGLYKDVSREYYEYDDLGNVVSQCNNNNESNIFSYDNNNALIKSTNAKGKDYKFEYDNRHTNRLLSAISSTGIVNQVKYDSFGNPIQTRISQKICPDLIDGKYKIRSKGTNKYLKANNSNELIVESNSCSNPVWELKKEAEYYKIIFTEQSNYSLSYYGNFLFLGMNNQNNLFKLELNDNGSYYLKMQNDDKYLKVNENDMMIFSNLIDGDPTFEFYFEILEQEFIENSATYTTDGRFISSVTDSNFNTTSYDNDFTTGLVTTMTNAKGISTNYSYNNNRQLTSVSIDNHIVNYNYNNNTLINKISCNNKDYNFIYDNFLNNKKLLVDDDVLLVENEYEDNNGNLHKVVYGNNHEITFDYDDFDRIKTLNKMNDIYNLKYDNNGNIAKIICNNYREKFNYDIKKRINEYRYNNFKIKYEYDSSDNVIKKEYRLNNKENIVNSTFDKNDQLTNILFDNKEFRYEYDGLGRLNKNIIDNNFNIVYEYVSHGKRTSELVKSIQIGDNKYNYKYDKLCNITDIYYNNNLVKKYYYDNINELIKEEDFEKNIKIEYTYDQSGNILNKITTDIVNNDIVSNDVYMYANDKWTDRLIKFNNKEITYDEIGNPLSFGNDICLSWVNGKELNSYQDMSKNLNVGFQYNKEGIRIKKVVNNVETNYYLDENRIIYEQRGNDLIHYLYDSTNILGLVYNDNIYYYLKNLQGDIIGLLDSSYNKIVSYEYDSWGNILSIKDANGNVVSDNEHIGIINPFRYRSYYYDAETGLYYLRNRYYSPILCRFINADNFEYLGVDGTLLSYNLFVFCMNNPINYFDTSGNWSLPNWAKVAIGATVIVGLAVATVCTCGTASVICGAALSGAISGGITGAVVGAASGAISGGKEGAIDGACSGFMEGTLFGGIVGATTSGLGVVSGTTKITGKAHGSTLHKFATNVEAGKMASTAKYSNIGLNKSLNTMGLKGSYRPDIIGISKNGLNRIVEVVSPRQSTKYIVNKMSSILSNNSDSTGKIISWVRELFE